MINGFLTLRGRRELNDDNAFYSLKKKTKQRDNSLDRVH